MKPLVLLVTFLSFLFSCSSQSTENTTGELPIVDLEKEYPVKRIDVHDLADIEYIPLETTENSLISQAGIYRVTTNSQLIIMDVYQGAIFFFDRTGKFQHSFNRFGQGAEEYLQPLAIAIDSLTNECFVYEQVPLRITVYSLSGEFKRRFNYSNGELLQFTNFYEYDKDNLIVYNDNYWPSPVSEQQRDADKTPYYLIDKQTGKVKSTDEHFLIPKHIPHTFQIVKGGSDRYSSPERYNYPQMLKNGSEILIANNALDTFYSYEDKIVKPVLVRTPSAQKMNSAVVIAPSVFTDDYFIYKKVPMDYNLAVEKGFDYRYFPSYILSRKTNQIFQMQLYDSMIEVNESSINRMPMAAFPQNGGFFPMYSKNIATGFYKAETLLEYLEKGVLRGKLKDVATQLKEDDNYVVIMYMFK